MIDKSLFNAKRDEAVERTSKGHYSSVSPALTTTRPGEYIMDYAVGPQPPERVTRPKERRRYQPRLTKVANELHLEIIKQGCRLEGELKGRRAGFVAGLLAGFAGAAVLAAVVLGVFARA